MESLGLAEALDRLALRLKPEPRAALALSADPHVFDTRLEFACVFPVDYAMSRELCTTRVLVTPTNVGMLHSRPVLSTVHANAWGMLSRKIFAGRDAAGPISILKWPEAVTGQVSKFALKGRV